MSKYGQDPYRTLKIEGRGVKGVRVELEGQDISPALSGLTLRCEGGSLPTATLEVALWETTVSHDRVNLHIPPQTRELLTRLGWTPPSNGEQQ